MAFKLLERSRFFIPDDCISITSVGFTFGTNASKIIGDKKDMEIYIDEENSLIGFKPVDSSQNGLKIIKSKFQKPTIIKATLVKNLKKGKVHFEIEDGLMVIKTEKLK